MSQAFVKETDSDPAGDLPDREISPHPNYVTAEGLAAIEAQLQELQAGYAKAQRAEDRAALAKLARELRYWTARRQSAELIAPVGDGRVRFGTRVTLQEGGEEKIYRIVGEDEADPTRGLLSYVSPLARALSGKEEGERVRAGAKEFEIVKIGE